MPRSFDKSSTAYDQHRESMARASRERSGSGRDIGEIPPCANPKRRAKAASSLRAHCELYFPQSFNLGWSADHLRVIDRIETAAREGGLFAFAMPRGSGKTTLCEAACSWVLLNGIRSFVALIGPSEDHAESILDAIKIELATNELLEADYPEVCVPIAKLDGIAQRANGQTCGGQRTHLKWEAKKIVLPSIKGSRSSGAIVRVAGLTGQIRGMRHKTADGRTIRPNFVLIDDPQTDESAASPSQCRTREGLLAGAILGLAGPGSEISGVMPCTVIRPGDMADAILDRSKHPEWRGERTKLVYEFPTETKLWDEYAALRRASMRDGGNGAPATKFYKKNRKAMDAGARIAWEARKRPDELSALQHAMNLRIDRGDAAFFAEFQNEPIPEVVQHGDELESDRVALKVSGLARGIVPTDASALTMFVDVQQSVLFYAVCAWAPDFTGWVVDYGAWPEQKARYWTLGEVKRTLSSVTKASGIEASIHAGLEALCAEQLDREWRTEGGGTMRIERAMIDANWGSSTDIVYQFCARSRWSAILSPAHGRFVGASSTQWSEMQPKQGERSGLRWRQPMAGSKRKTRHVLFDANWWKGFVHERLAVGAGSGSLALYQAEPDVHRMIADHIVSERRIPVTARGRTVDEWRLKRPGIDNHWFDCLVGCAVSASMSGCALPSIQSDQPRVRKKRSMAALFAQRARERGVA